MVKKQKSLLRVLCLTLALCLLLVGSALAATLQKGNTGNAVVRLQQQLSNAGYPLAIDGVFGTETYRALVAFQRKHQLKVTGKADEKTQAVLARYDSPASDGKGLQGRTNFVKETAPFVPQSGVQTLLTTARKYIGVRYVFGGTTPRGGFDCSGYVQYVFRECGYTVPRTADIQFEIGKNARNSSELVPGDLVFFTTYEPGASHVGIYLGYNQFIHASSSRGVTISSLMDEYYRQHYYGAKKVVIVSDSAATTEPVLSDKERRKKEKAEEKARREAEKQRKAEEERRQAEAERAAEAQAKAERAAEAKRKAEEAEQAAEAKRKAEAAQQQAEPAKPQPAPTRPDRQPPRPDAAPKQSNNSKTPPRPAAKPDTAQAPKPSAPQSAKPPARPTTPVKETNPSPMGQHKTR